MNKRLLLTLPLTVSLLALAGCGEESNTQTEANAAAAEQTQIADAAQADATPTDAIPAESSSAPAIAQEGITGIYCHTTETHKTALVAIESPAEGKLTFSFSKWNNANGAKCGTVELEGMKTTDGLAWSVSKTDPYEEGAVCILTVKPEADAITIKGNGDCVQMCGARETIDTITYPLASKTERPATQAEIVGLYEDNTICP